MEKRKASHPPKPHATSQPSRFSHTPRLSTDAAHNQHSYQERPIHTSRHDAESVSTGPLPKGAFVHWAMQLLSVTVQWGNRRSGLVISREQGLRYDAGFAVPVLMS